MDSENGNSENRKILKHVFLYSDGSCSSNPGPGGYGTILEYNGYRKEFHQSFPCTTNNRMEIMGVIVGLQNLREPCKVTVITDSQYVVNTMTKGWKRNKNEDLWQMLDALSKMHQVDYRWVRGHNGHPQNERCDELARLR